MKRRPFVTSQPRLTSSYIFGRFGRGPLSPFYLRTLPKEQQPSPFAALAMSSSGSASSSRSGSPLPELDPSTLAILDSFYASKAEEEKLFNDLAERLTRTYDGDHDNDDQDTDTRKAGNSMISVDEFRIAFGEDWQLSQFWYTTEFAYGLAKCIHHLCSGSLPIDDAIQAGPTAEPTIAFLCCPTAFVAFTHMYPPNASDASSGAGFKYTALLLEHDQRFGCLPLSPPNTRFIPYDLTDPEKIPADILAKVDVALVDPPYLNQRTNKHLATTLRRILNPEQGKVLVITSTSLELEEDFCDPEAGLDVHASSDAGAPSRSPLHAVYNSPPIGPLRRTQLVVKHVGLRNEFACWGSWDGAEAFGRLDQNAS